MKTGIPSVDELLQNATHIICSDEVGNGALAGSLMIGAVCVPIDFDWTQFKGLTDSKKLEDHELERLSSQFRAIRDPQVSFAVEPHSHEDIDRMGLAHLLPWAHEWAIKRMVETCTQVMKGRPACIVDGTMSIPGALSLPKADLLIPACSMASVLAKYERDQVMADLDKVYPGYDFAQSVGYSSPLHIAGLEKMGPCEIHRRSYSSYDKYKIDNEMVQNAWELLE
jgi:ribonuclease HII